MAGLEGMRLGSCLVKRHIGDGGIGDVYLAEQPELGRMVAVKVVRRELDPGATQEAAAFVTQQFTQEARVIASLEHPNILPIFEFGEQDGLHYLIMPYVPDGSLEDLLVPGPQHRLDLPLPPTLAASIIDQAADALQYAHDHGIVHRDVKPHNLLVRFLPAPSATPAALGGVGGAGPADPGQVYLHILLADFGLARFMSAISSQTHTTGTPMYTAPEQYAGQPGPATDQYALACIAYLLLTAQPVFVGTAAELYHQHISLIPALARTRHPGLPPAVDPVLARALLKDPALRYPRVRDFAAALHVAIDPSVQMQQPGAWPRATTAGPVVPAVPIVQPAPLVPAVPIVPAGGAAGWTPQPANPWAAQAAPAAPAVWQTGPSTSSPGSSPVAATPLSPPLPAPFSTPLSSPPSTPLAASLLRPPVPPNAPPFQTFSTGPSGGGLGGQVTPQRDAPGARIPRKRRTGVSRRAVLFAAAGLAVASAGAAGFVWFERRSSTVNGTPEKNLTDTVGYYRPSTNTFYLASSLDHPEPDLTIRVGTPGGLPVVGDWDGDGIDAVGFFRRSSSSFFLWEWNTARTQLHIAHSLKLGDPGDVPIAGDWTGSGRDGVGVFRPSTGVFYLMNTPTGTRYDYAMPFGRPNDIPIVGDWVGDGVDRVGVFRPSNATYYLAGRACNCVAPVIYSFPWGGATDVPFAGRWTTASRSGIGVFRPNADTMYLLYDIMKPGNPDLLLYFGQAGDIPVAGHWK